MSKVDLQIRWRVERDKLFCGLIRFPLGELRASLPFLAKALRSHLKKTASPFSVELYRQLEGDKQLILYHAPFFEPMESRMNTTSWGHPRNGEQHLQGAMVCLCPQARILERGTCHDIIFAFVTIP